ncbi:MAG: ribonuclease HII [Bacillota bacterium]
MEKQALHEQSIRSIKQLLSEVVDRDTLRILEQDERKGVQDLLTRYYKNEQKQAQLEKDYQLKFKYEQVARKESYQWIAGVDEVGRGPLAGPVVAAAVILPETCDLIGLTDSKQLSESKREYFYQAIQREALAIGIGIVSPEVIDAINILEASKQAMLEAIQSLEVTPDYLLLDAIELNIAIPQQSLIKGDMKSISIAAASVIAKVTRDRLMSRYDKQYPGYDFFSNQGYGTKKHLEGLKKHGVTPIHRRSFAPVRVHL